MYQDNERMFIETTNIAKIKRDRYLRTINDLMSYTIRLPVKMTNDVETDKELKRLNNEIIDIKEVVYGLEYLVAVRDRKGVSETILIKLDRLGYLMKVTKFYVIKNKNSYLPKNIIVQQSLQREILTTILKMIIGNNGLGFQPLTETLYNKTIKSLEENSFKLGVSRETRMKDYFKDYKETALY